MKPIVVAVVGKSASGKDTLCRLLSRSIGGGILRDTTRPKRASETNGVEYNFISTQEFLVNIDNKHYLEYQEFRGWYYGTPKSALNNAINVGTFTPKGFADLVSSFGEAYEIYGIYIESNWLIRLCRSIKRDGKFSFEIIRRMFSDYKDFKAADIEENNNFSLLVTNRDGTNMVCVAEKVLAEMEKKYGEVINEHLH